jgi:hypothetical protein
MFERPLHSRRGREREPLVFGFGAGAVTGITMLSLLIMWVIFASRLVVVAAAGEVPTYDFGPTCRSIATLNHSIERCTSDEEEARAKLARQWNEFSPADKDICQTVTRAAGPSYVELLTCLQIGQATRPDSEKVGANASD